VGGSSEPRSSTEAPRPAPAGNALADLVPTMRRTRSACGGRLSHRVTCPSRSTVMRSAIVKSLQPVRDVEDEQARLQPGDDVKDCAARRARGTASAVEDQDPRGDRERRADLDELLAGDGKRRLGGRSRAGDSGQEPRSPRTDAPSTSRRVVGSRPRKMFRRRSSPERRSFLIDDADAGHPRRGVLNATGSRQRISPRSTEHAARRHERGLPGAFAPTGAWTRALAEVHGRERSRGKVFDNPVSRNAITLLHSSGKVLPPSSACGLDVA